MKRSIGGTKFENTPQSRAMRKTLRVIHTTVRKHFNAYFIQDSKGAYHFWMRKPSTEEGD